MLIPTLAENGVKAVKLALALSAIVFLARIAIHAEDPEPKIPRVRVAGILLKWIPGDKEANYRRAEILVREAARQGARVVATPESFLDGYAARNPYLTQERFRSLAEPVPGGTYFERMRTLADELDIYFVASIPELDGGEVFNSAVLIGPDGKWLGTYRKNYLWQGEKDKYRPGHSYPVFDTEFGKLGLLICFDRQHRPAIEALADNGAEWVIIPSGGGYGPQSHATMAQRSDEGRVPIVFVHPIEFLVTDRFGNVLSSAQHGSTLDDPNGLDPGAVRYFDLPMPSMRR